MDSNERLAGGGQPGAIGARKKNRPDGTGSTSRQRLALAEQVIGPRPNFWQELYWFGIICLGAVGLALYLLPSPLLELRKSLATEREVSARLERLKKREHAIREAVVAVKKDEFFREELFHDILGVYAENEETLLPRHAIHRVDLKRSDPGVAARQP